MILITIGLVIALTNDNWYVGDVWHDTLDEALLNEADKHLESKDTLTIQTLISTKKIDDITIMTFVSQNDTFVTVTFVSNEDGLYSVSGYTEEESLLSPSEFVVTGAQDQYVIFPYSTYKNTVYGWCYSSVVPSVNGLKPSLETFEIECQGDKWKLTYWYISEINDTDNVKVSFNLK